MVVLGVVVAVVAVLALRSPHHGSSSADNSKNNHPTRSASPSPSPSRTPSTTPSASGAPVTSTVSVSAGGSGSPQSVPLVVLNNTSVHGLAEQAAATFRAGGWTVTSVGNYQNNILSTCAYYDPTASGAQAAAQALQRQFPAIKRVEPKFDGLVAGPIVVVLTDDYAS